MIRPTHFRHNEQTSVNNYYQKVLDGVSKDDIELKAQEEFDTLASKLKSSGVDVTIIQDSLDSDTPDSIFPNNWISFHPGGDVVIYPMYAENRRKERRKDIIDRFKPTKITDLTYWEKGNKFLEGTGSMVLDRVNKIAYAALSPRTHEEVLNEFCKKFKYSPIVFNTYQTIDNKRQPVYHTNVIMCVGKDFAVLCKDSIDDKTERNLVVESLTKAGKSIIYITEQQVERFAGNMLEVKDAKGDPMIIMSSSAFYALSQIQKDQLNSYARIVHSSLDTIEACGGGSARCMLAETF